jgi:hypothetical protein
MGEAEDSGVSRCEGLGTAGWGKPRGDALSKRNFTLFFATPNSHYYSL